MRKKIETIIVSLITIIIFALGTLIKNINLMFAATLILLLVLFMYAIKRKALVLTMFLISFFTFLMGGYLIDLATEKEMINEFTLELNMHMILCLFLSLIGILIGTFICKNKTEKFNNYNIEKDYKIYKIKIATKILFYITFLFNAITIIEKVIFVQTNTYLELYTSYTSKLPILFTKIAQMNDFLFYTYLSTMPSKSEIKKPVILYMIIQIISILSGGRSRTVTGLLFIFGYFVFREYNSRKKDNQKEIWLKKSHIKIAVLITPVLIAFLSAYNLIRNGIKIEQTSILKQFIQFFKDQGGSIKLIAYAKKCESLLPQNNKVYSLYPIIAFFRDGIIGQIFFSTTPFKVNTIEMALYGNNFGATISYIIMPELYLQGHGLGTQYIAEVYTDFSYLGVFIFNIILGILLIKLNFRTNIKWYWSAINLSIIRLVIYMPRDFALSWISAFWSITNWGSIIFVIILSRIIKVKEGENNENTLDS